MPDQPALNLDDARLLCNKLIDDANKLNADQIDRLDQILATQQNKLDMITAHLKLFQPNHKSRLLILEQLCTTTAHATNACTERLDAIQAQLNSPTESANLNITDNSIRSLRNLVHEIAPAIENHAQAIEQLQSSVTSLSKLAALTRTDHDSHVDNQFAALANQVSELAHAIDAHVRDYHDQ